MPLEKHLLLAFKWSDFQTQATVGKLRTSAMQKSRKLSARELPSTVKSRKFSLVKLKCYTVAVCGPLFNITEFCAQKIGNEYFTNL